MLKLPDKLFDIDTNDIEIGSSTIHLYEKDKIEKMQRGYRYNGLTGEPIEDWFGDAYVVIGVETCCGDPIIAKIDEEDLPIYYMFHDDWSTLQKVANSLEQFINMLKKINNTYLETEEEYEELINDIKKEVPNTSYDYWESIIELAYDFAEFEEE